MKIKDILDERERLRQALFALPGPRVQVNLHRTKRITEESEFFKDSSNDDSIFVYLLGGGELIVKSDTIRKAVAFCKKFSYCATIRICMFTNDDNVFGDTKYLLNVIDISVTVDNHVDSEKLWDMIETLDPGILERVKQLLIIKIK